MGRSRNSIRDAFVFHTLPLLESPAWRALPNNARRFVERLEIEHMQHAGTHNGQLICTYDQLAKSGIRRPSIALAIRQSVALGFVQITREGFRTSGGRKVPSTYKLTHVRSSDTKKDGLPTDEWKRLSTEALAQKALADAATKETTGSAKSGRGRPRQSRQNGGPADQIAIAI